MHMSISCVTRQVWLHVATQAVVLSLTCLSLDPKVVRFKIVLSALSFCGPFLKMVLPAASDIFPLPLELLAGRRVLEPEIAARTAPRRLGKASKSVRIFARDPLCRETCRYCRRRDAWYQYQLAILETERLH